jgi:hypothetical protein
MTLFLKVDPFQGDDGSDASALITGFSLLSHVPILFAGVLNQTRGALFLALWCYIELALSLWYHACRGGIYCFGLPFNGARFDDHFGALNLVCALALHLIQYDHTRGAAGAWARYLQPAVVLVSVQAWPYQLQSAILVLGYLLVVTAYRYLAQGALVPPRRERFVLKWALLGLVFLLLAALCYLYDSGTRGGSATGDGAVHAVWHLLAGLALLALSAAIVDDDTLAPVPPSDYLPTDTD